MTRNGRPGELLDVLDAGTLYYVVVLNGERVPLLKTECTVVPEKTYTDVTATCTVTRDIGLTHAGELIGALSARGYRFRYEGPVLLVEQETR